MKVDYSQKTYRLSLSFHVRRTDADLPVSCAAFCRRAAVDVLCRRVVPYPAHQRKELGTSILMFVGTYLFSLLLTPDFASSLPYLLLFGHYGIVWYFCGKAKDKLSASILRLVYCNVGMVLIYLFASRIVVDDFWRAFPWSGRLFLRKWPLWPMIFVWQTAQFLPRVFARSIVRRILREGIRACRYGKSCAARHAGESGMEDLQRRSLLRRAYAHAATVKPCSPARG